jgi:hypothetical protein
MHVTRSIPHPGTTDWSSGVRRRWSHLLAILDAVLVRGQVGPLFGERDRRYPERWWS